jgi:hypothetical protein
MNHNFLEYKLYVIILGVLGMILMPWSHPWIRGAGLVITGVALLLGLFIGIMQFLGWVVSFFSRKRRR